MEGGKKGIFCDLDANHSCLPGRWPVESTVGELTGPTESDGRRRFDSSEQSSLLLTRTHLTVSCTHICGMGSCGGRPHVQKKAKTNNLK